VILAPGSLVLLIGAPASGKSTLAGALVDAGEVAAGDVLSTDTYREVMGGSALELKNDRRIWTEIRNELDERMAAGRTTVIDATNIFPRRRARHIRVAREHGRPVVAIRFDVSTAELVARNEGRERVLRPNVVVTMAVEMDQEATAETLADEDIDVVLDAEDVRRLLS
jgi:predicted kinase